MELQDVILYPLATEKAKSPKMWMENKIVFCVALKANKPLIKRAVEYLYDVEVDKVNTLIRPDGRKIAYVKLKPKYKAEKLAIKLRLV